ncbi:hypothetical protein NQZ68_014161 [Dissostichus eleginoides]|nr:hypothetical protein NQZ68_014161 [Dissostichus eleginoides]
MVVKECSSYKRNMGTGKVDQRGESRDVGESGGRSKAEWTGECKPRLTHLGQTEEPHIDGTDSRRQAPLPCGSQQLKRGH